MRIPQLEMVRQGSIQIPPFMPGASKGFTALNRILGTKDQVLLRGVPEDNIIHARLTDDYQLVDPVVFLSPEMCPLYYDRKRHIHGVEDPTCVESPLVAYNKAFVTATAYKDERDHTKGVSACLYLVLGRLGEKALIKPIYTPDNGVQDGLGLAVDMTKEYEELWFHNNAFFSIFEYGDIGGEPKMSCLGLLTIEGSLPTRPRAKPFLTPIEDRLRIHRPVAHLSTCGSPVPLGDDRYLLFINRREDEIRDGQMVREWGITYLVIRKMPDGYPEIEWEYPGWVIRAPHGARIPKEGESGAGQLINFGSCVTQLRDGTIEVLSHVADDRPYFTILRIV